MKLEELIQGNWYKMQSMYQYFIQFNKIDANGIVEALVGFYIYKNKFIKASTNKICSFEDIIELRLATQEEINKLPIEKIFDKTILYEIY